MADVAAHMAKGLSGLHRDDGVAFWCWVGGGGEDLVWGGIVVCCISPISIFSKWDV